MNPIVEAFRAKSKNGYEGKSDEELILAIGEKFPDFLKEHSFRVDYLKAKSPDLFKNSQVEQAVRESPQPIAQEDIPQVSPSGMDMSYRAQLARQMKSEQAPSLQKMASGALMNVGSGIRSLMGQAGGVIESPLLGGAIPAAVEAVEILRGKPGKGPVVRAIKGLTQTRKEIGQGLADENLKEAAEFSKTAEAINPDIPSQVPGLTVGAMVSSAPSLVAGLFGGFPAAIATAGIQSFGGTYADAVNRYEQELGDREEARQKAFGPAIVSGVITAGATKLFGGTEKFFAQLGSGALKGATGRKILGRVLAAGGLEGPEEFVDQLLQGINAKFTYDPEKTWTKNVNEALAAGGIGLLAGLLTAGMAGTARHALNQVTKPQQKEPNDQEIRQQVPSQQDGQEPGGFPIQIRGLEASQGQGEVTPPGPVGRIIPEAELTPPPPTPKPVPTFVGYMGEIPLLNVPGPIPGRARSISPQTAEAEGYTLPPIPTQQEWLATQRPATPPPALASTAPIQTPTAPLPVPTVPVPVRTEVPVTPAPVVAPIPEAPASLRAQITQALTPTVLELSVERQGPPMPGPESLPQAVLAGFQSWMEGGRKAKGRKELDKTLQAYGLEFYPTYKQVLGLNPTQAPDWHGNRISTNVAEGLIEDPKDRGGFEMLGLVPDPKNIGSLSDLLLQASEKASSPTTSKILKQLGQFAASHSIAPRFRFRGGSSDAGAYNPLSHDVVLATDRNNTFSENVLIHESVHVLTARYVRKFTSGMDELSGEAFLNSLNTALSNQATPQPIRDLIETYLHAVQSLGLTERLFGNSQKLYGDMAIAGTGSYAARTHKAGIPYGFGNLDEFLAEAFSDSEFQKVLDGIPSNDPGKSLWVKFIDFLRELFPAFKDSGTVLADILSIGSTIMEQDVSQINLQGKGPVAHSLESALATLRQTQAEGTPQEQANAAQNLEMEQAAAITANVPAAREEVGSLQELVEQRNRQGDVRIRGAGLQRFRVVQAVVAHPLMQKYLIQPVIRLNQSAQALAGSITNFEALKNAKSSTPQMISNAARLAGSFLDDFYTDLFSFRSSYDSKKEALLKEIGENLKRGEEAVSEREAMNALVSEFEDIMNGMVSVSNDQARLEAIVGAINNVGGARNALKFVTRHVNLAQVGTARTVAEVVDLINAAATGRLTPQNNTIDDVILANKQSVRAVAHFLLNSSALREQIEATKNFIAGVATTGVGNEFKTKLAKLVNDGDYGRALLVFTTGVGDTVAKRNASRAMARVTRHKEQKLLVELAAMEEVRAKLDAFEQSPEFRAASKEIYDRLNVKEQIRTITGRKWVLKPIYAGDKEVTISSLANKSLDEVKALNEWYQRALYYVKDVKHPEWDPVKAAAVEAFAKNEGLELNPSFSPLAGHFLQSGPRAVIRTVFGWLGKVDRIPRWMIDSTAGYASDMVHRAQAGYSTISELTVAIGKERNSHILRKLKTAMDAHKMDERDYENKIYNPLAASLQSFANPKRLGVWSTTPGGHIILAEDMAYFLETKAYEKAIIDAVNSTGEETFKSIQLSPTGVIFKRNGKIAFRLPMETGPGTVHRRLTSMWNWYGDWTDATTQAQQIKFLNANLDRILVSYVSDVNNPEYHGTYAYGAEFKEIMREAGENPILSFDDLVNRTFIKFTENQAQDEDAETDEEVTPQTIQDQILSEINGNFAKWRRLKGPPSDKDLRTLIEAWGGPTSWNTERGAQIVPSGWYDYGFISMYQRMAHTHNAKAGFAIELHNSLEALAAAIDGEVKLFQDRKRAKEKGIQSKSRQAQINGEIFYNWREARILSEEVHHYLNELKATLAFEERREGMAGFEDQPVDPNIFINLPISTLLADPVTQSWNAMGGATRIMLFDIVHRRRQAMAQLALAGPRTAVLAWREGLRFLSYDKESQYLFKALNDARLKPIIGKIAELIHREVENLHRADLKKQAVGITLNIDLIGTVKTEAALWRSGGLPGEESTGPIALPLRAVNFVARSASEVMRQGSVGYVDGLINGRALGYIIELEKDLSKRAVEFGAERVRRAQEDGRDPYDISNILNRFTDQELVGGRHDITSSGPAALKLRQFITREGGGNSDYLIWDFYKRWDAAGRPEEKDGYYGDLRFFDPATYNQLVVGHSKSVNLAAFDTRPILMRKSRFAQVLGIFHGYVADLNYSLTSIADKESRKTWAEGTVRNLPALINSIVVMAALGAMAGWLSDEVRKLVWKRFAAIPTIISDQTTASLLKTILTGFAAQQPFYGTFINNFTGRTLKRGWDLNTMFLVLNEAQDAMDAFKEAIQTGDYVRPPLKLATSYTPVKFIGPALKPLTGLNEISQVSNLLIKGARSAGMEMNLRTPFSGRSGQREFEDTYAGVNAFWNAIGNQEFDEAMEAFGQLRDIYAKDGKGDVDDRAIRSVEGRHPSRRAFDKKITTAELNEIMARLTPEEQAYITRHLDFFDRVMTSIKPIGASPYRMTRDPTLPRPRTRNTIDPEMRESREFFAPRERLELERSSRDMF